MEFQDSEEAAMFTMNETSMNTTMGGSEAATDDGAAEGTTIPYSYYQDGDEMEQVWNPAFVIFAYVISFVSAYSAVHLLDHSLWRAEELKKSMIIKHPQIYAATMLGFGTVWCMHYVGMAAVTLEGAPVCYNWPITFASLGAVVLLMIAGIKVAGHDVFATPDRVKILEGVLGNNYLSEKEAMWAITRVTSFHKLQHLAVGSLLAALGAIVMHYTGMRAQRGPFVKQWNVGLVATSVVIGVVIVFVGFWIMFRLRWKIQQLWLRYVSAAVIAAGVCGLHFFGMLSATYYYDSSREDTCQRTWDQNSASPSAWTDHQMIIVAIGILVPLLSFYIMNIINQELILAYEVASRSNAIVTSLFPAKIRDQMLADDKNKLKNFLTSGSSEADDDLAETTADGIKVSKSKPIADLFTDTTIMFADIAGFTSWSSTREPSQVFTLLETVYQTFDELTQRHGCFKVETVGDCYVAVAGLPEPRKDHAVVMCRVARDCVYKMSILTKRLEVMLGPDTAELNIRIGLNSGPVTAGVLRGDRARFQLFGDTMHLASRMESTGFPGRIQLSAETTELLKVAGKDRWVTPRNNVVFVKGKGELQTYWLVAKGERGSGSGSGSQISGTESSNSQYAKMKKTIGDDFYKLTNDKTSRLIEWNVDVLSRILKEIVARRNSRSRPTDKSSRRIKVDESIIQAKIENSGETVLDEVCEIIELPQFDAETRKRQEDPGSIVLPDNVVAQLREYVKSLSDLYRSNPFHNFDHASHVTMSVSKLLSRITSHKSEGQAIDSDKCLASSLHDHTYGITSDPLTHFACILSALIHDADHEGVPNMQLINEGAPVAALYNNKSIAEQNSVDVAWHLLMEGNYKDLRSTIYSSNDEMKRFRQLIVNSVMATDIMDKDLKNLRNARWDKAFSEQRNVDEDSRISTNRKATIVIEHLIQASDVAHTMQHWNVYRKWNEKLFEEMYKAYKEGRSDTDPSTNWYKGEIGFFDFYIIPLAKKLKDCGVFGVSSDEYLNYAKQNRREWEARGMDIVSEYMENVNSTWANMRVGETCEITEEESVSSS